MFGRYSLDKPGLILANQGEGLEDYLSIVGRPSSVVAFLPDKDNAIPILDGDWFSDDITERFKQFLRVTFGQEQYADNLAFIEAALGRDIRSYFLRDFYNDHVKVYKKRPIYWLFSSGKGSFNVLIYMHRYRPDTVSIILNDYLREYRAKLTARKTHLESVSVSAGASPRDKTQALKEIDRLDKILRELREYEDDILYPLATRQLQIDLDDGVKVNYNKFGPALKTVTGLTEK
jgi:type II restriction/modification system DNA methylase subunit YeeA